MRLLAIPPNKWVASCFADSFLIFERLRKRGLAAANSIVFGFGLLSFRGQSTLSNNVTFDGRMITRRFKRFGNLGA